MGATHLNAISKIPGIEVTGVCTTNERALEGDLTAVGGNLDVPAVEHDFTHVRKSRDWQEFLTFPEFDAVDICLPTDLHANIAVAAMQAGKHVLCEKPMALSQSDCHRMLEAAEKHNRVLMIGHLLRFWPAYEALHDFVKGGQYGAIRSVQLLRSAGLPDWSRWLPVEGRSGGAVVDLLIHDIDQAIWLFGMPERVAAKSQGAVDTLAAALSYPDDLQVEIKGGWLPAGEPFVMGFEAKAEHARMELVANNLFLDDDTGRHEMPSAKHDAYQAEIAYFAQCCETGSKPERCSAQESAEAVELALLLKYSRAKEGQSIKC